MHTETTKQYIRIAIGSVIVVPVGVEEQVGDLQHIDAAVAKGDLQRGGELHQRLAPLCRAMFCESNPIPVKTACAWLGLIPTAELRLPMTPLSESGRDLLERCLTVLGLHPRVSDAPPSTHGPVDVPSRENAEASTVEYDLKEPGEATA